MRRRTSTSRRLAALLIVGSPWLFRYSRVLWMYLDQAIDPR